MDHARLIRRRLLKMLRDLDAAPAGESGTLRGYLYGYMDGLLLAELLTPQEHGRVMTLAEDINQRRLARI